MDEHFRKTGSIVFAFGFDYLGLAGCLELLGFTIGDDPTRW